ncbi:MAG: bifunctional alpha,alpha-trehalose-phosphate synthase (UDP-forming)/trehalose-phosphatase, partial [Polyangiales bacterium]
MGRLLIVSNRLPVTVRVDQGELVVARSAGGLATAMSGPHERMDSLWIGWPGDVSRMSEAHRREADARLAELHTLPVHLSQAQIARYYEGFSNGVLWPLFHYLIETVQLGARRDWEVYCEVNQRFADAVISQYREGDTIWVHDYQLTLVPEMLRARLPDAHIGFFLHIPFPSSEVFRVLPWRDRILRGLLGADVLGFHTASFRHNFVSSAARVLGLEADFDVLRHEGRDVRLGVYPISIDFAEFERIAQLPSVIGHVEHIRAEAAGRTLLLGVDRFDYTKGIPARLLAFERLLERSRDLRRKLRYVQLAVPTREHVDAYATLRRSANEISARINAQYGSVGSVPIHFLHRSTSPELLVALYRAADIMLVTPLRDGMNLVAKEYVASRVDEDGVLVLSEFAGAADELTDAVLVNPYDIDGMAASIQQAISMPEDERRSRMRALRRHVRAHDVHEWAKKFLDDLGGDRHAKTAARTSIVSTAETLSRQIASAESLELFIDYDGTLVPLVRTPDLARPDPALLALLRRLAERPHTRVHIVSGRKHEDLQDFLGDLPVALHAEHGFWMRPRDGVWQTVAPLDGAWKDNARAILEGFAARTPGASVEEKTVSLAFHYRRVDPELASARLRELRHALAELVRAHGLELL